MNTHPVVLATIRRHLAEAELRLAVLKVKREEIPVTRLHRQITQLSSWRQVESDAANLIPDQEF